MHNTVPELHGVVARRSSMARYTPSSRLATQSADGVLHARELSPGLLASAAIDSPGWPPVGATVRRRWLGAHEGQQPGPTMVVVGGIHGNEPAGVIA
ncbi:MAG TPA: hypothetical protein VK034_08695, partial [Enhygromyxa sp.]|nr:hypothetical protein [Enhygromyxa sp.]